MGVFTLMESYRRFLLFGAVLFGLAGGEVRAQVRDSVPGAAEPRRAVVPPGPGTLSASKVEEA